MAQKTNSFEKFWKELKRRKVIHVITVYAAVAFVILQLVDMISQPLHFPEWTQGFIIVLLCIGFVIAVLLSWVYDITPSGVKRTRTISSLKHTDHPTFQTSSGWKIATYVSGSVIVALIAFNFISKRNLNADISKLDKSIAVLPFINESPVDSNKYFINGIMEEVLTNLQKIRDFRVLSRTSTEQYEDQDRPTIPEIAKKLGVSYIIEGSGQKYGNKFRLRVQLIKAKGKENHLWAQSYEQELKEPTELFNIQSQIAQAIATELKATITSEEKELIEKKPTKYLEAYNLYLQGRFFWNKRQREGLKKSIEYFEKSVALDSTYALAYAGLADAYFIMAYWEWIPKEDGYARAKEYALRALEIDSDLAEAHATLGWLYCWGEWKWEDSRRELKLATELNPNYANAHQYFSELLDVLRENNEARRQINIALELDPLVPVYHWQSRNCFYNTGNYNKALEEIQRLQELAPDYTTLPLLYFNCYIKLNEGLKAMKELQNIFVNDSTRTKYVKSIEESYNKSGTNGLFDLLIELELKHATPDAFNLAAWYSILNKKNDALYWLEKTIENPPSGFPDINNSPIFDKIRSDPRFQAIIKKMGLAEYQTPK